MKQFQFIILIVLILSACGDSSTNNSNNSTTDNQNNNQTNMNDNKVHEYSLPKLITYVETDNLVSNFYPIGWSKDGKLAYIEEPADEATGFYFFKLVVQDLKTDKQEIIFEYNESDEKEEATLQSTWNENYELFKEKLNAQKIIPIENIQLGKTEFENNEKKYQIEVKTETRNDDMFGLDVIKKAQVIVKSGDKEKNILTYKSDDGLILEFNVVGILQSPYENKVAVIYTTTQRGYEGPPHVIQAHIAGCNLDKGF